METTLERQPSKVFDNSTMPLHVAHRLLQTACLSESGVVTELHITAHTITFTYITDMLHVFSVSDARHTQEIHTFIIKSKVCSFACGVILLE